MRRRKRNLDADFRTGSIKDPNGKRIRCNNICYACGKWAFGGGFKWINGVAEFHCWRRKCDRKSNLEMWRLMKMPFPSSPEYVFGVHGRLAGGEPKMVQ